MSSQSVLNTVTEHADTSSNHVLPRPCTCWPAPLLCLAHWQEATATQQGRFVFASPTITRRLCCVYPPIQRRSQHRLLPSLTAGQSDGQDTCFKSPGHCMFHESGPLHERGLKHTLRRCSRSDGGNPHLADSAMCRLCGAGRGPTSSKRWLTLQAICPQRQVSTPF